jgi:hypothetical protein
VRLILIVTLAITAALFLAPARAQQATPKAPEHDKMMADMTAGDARLEALTQTMTSASGNDKVRAMQALLTQLVQNQVGMHRQMSLMHDHMMSQMPHQ